MKEKMMKNMGYLIALLDVAVYFILSYVVVGGFQDNIVNTLVNGSLLFVGAIVATNSMMKQGLLSGSESEKYKETVASHIKQKQKIFSKLSKLQPWLDKNWQDLTRIGRTVFTNSAGFEYSKVFSDDGIIKSNFKVDKPKFDAFSRKWWGPIKLLIKLNRWLFSTEWKFYREQKKLIRKAKRYSVTRLTVSDLFDIEANNDPNYFGMTEKEYVSKQTGVNIISRLIFSCLLPTISFTFIGFNMGTFVIQLTNIFLILMTALFSMFCAYSFKVKTHRNTIISKINKLEEFDNTNLDEFNSKEINDGKICSEKSSSEEANMVQTVSDQ